ncbi:MAG: DUF6089 family protein [Bacteroidia bacterium]
MSKLKVIVVLLVVLLPSLASAQRYKQRWKSYRTEVHFGAGVTNFLGELGGADQVGTDYFKDLEISETNLAISAGFRYRLSQVFSLNNTLTYGRVTGDDALTKEFFRNYRNLNFRSDIVEASSTVEVALIKEQVGARYRLKGIRGARGFELSAYAFAGLGLFYFNPKGEYRGEWVNLAELNTEGQGLTDTRKDYSRIQLAIPVGIGFKYGIDRRWSVGLQYGIRKTFTDYIDDVSKTYYSPSALTSSGGSLAAEMADKSDNEFPYITAVGEQRGDPRDKDSYMFAIFSISYKLRTGRSGFPMF